MKARNSPKAQLLTGIPAERVEYAADCDSYPKAGDIVELDQGFTGPHGESMGMVVCRNADGGIKWTGDVMDSEIELLR